jgi:hypothetical protein
MAIVSLWLVGWLGCSSSQTPQKMAAQWDVQHGFVMPAEVATSLVQAHEGLLWVTGAGVSMPLELLPQQLPATNTRGETMIYPDVSVPTAIPTGTELAIRVAGADGKLSEVVAEMVIEPSSGPSVALYDTFQWSQKQCYSPCNPNCNWCSACPVGYNCGGRADGPWITSNNSPVCATHGGPCSGGSTHACWTTTWVENCIP